MAANPKSYPARLDVAYSPELDRVSTFFRLLLAIPILIILSLLTGDIAQSFANGDGNQFVAGAGGVGVGLFVATALMILFRQRYPRWWFDFALELQRFSMRVNAYVLLLTDRYPSTEDKQSVDLAIDYPDVEQELVNWLPLVKWVLAIPHYVVLIFLLFAAGLATIIAWFAILFTGRYPKELFDFVVGVLRWQLRVSAYMLLLVTDEYPPFSLK